ncbi:MAG: hypothetical protein OER90_06930 [Gemmatimonadota bacterium]|nr:hypothetical protein [Gemmatimonadota bacterium]
MLRAFPVAVVAAVIGLSVFRYGDAATPFTASATVSQQAGDFDWQGQLQAGQAIEIKGVNGSIEAVRAGGRRITVRATKRAGDKGNVADVTFEVVEHGDGVTICAVYPSKDADKPNECAPGGKGRMNLKDNDTRVSFSVQVPDGVNLVARTVNGGIEAEGIGSDVHAHTVNGNVEVTAAGHVWANTVNGSIDVRMGRAEWSGDLALTTVNGSITVSLPDNVGAEVSASTVNGAIETEFPLTVQGRFGPKQLKGMIGSGGRKLTLSTVNGGLRLQRGG